MPTYGYECKECGHTFDFFQSMKDEPLKTCPKCGKELRRLINGGTGVIFKGNGFYATDKSAKSGKADSAPDGKAGDASKTTPAKTESVPCPGCAKSDTCPKAVNS
jgi:putative FmdB family regulatory protein